MPRLKCTFRDFIDILVKHGFELEATRASSHKQYRAEIGGVIRKVTVAAHDYGAEIKLGTLQSMIRQSGLPSKLFRK